MIEIDLTKLERGTRTGTVTVRRGGKVFQRKQRLGVKDKLTERVVKPNSKPPMMKRLDIKAKLNIIVGKEIVDDFQNRINGMSKEDLNKEFTKMQNESPNYHERYLEEWTRRGRDLIDGYITQKFDLEETNSRLYKTEYEIPFPNSPLAGPFTSDKILMKSILLNQERLRRDYPDGTVSLYRGLGPTEYDATDGLKKGDQMDIRTYNIASWSEYKDVSNLYASLGGKGLVVKTDVPIENILWSSRLEGPTAGRGKLEDKDGFEYAVIHGGYQPTEIVSRDTYEKKADFDDLYDLMAEIRKEERNAGRL